MDLQTLIAGLRDQAVVGDAAAPIRGVAYHSAQVREGFLFVAIRGHALDGHAFIHEAVARGASALLVERRADVPEAVTQVIVPDTRVALALVATAFYNFPSRRLTVVGVTGTNGKGVTTYFTDAILNQAGYRSAVIGTMGVKTPAGTVETGRTTPESLDLQRLLADLAHQGVTHVAMEVASHGLALRRVDGTRFAVAVFTNLTQDHLDFHGSLEMYRAAKRRLFEMVEPDGASVINAGDPAGDEMAGASRAPVIRYAADAGGDRMGDGGHAADLRATDIRLDLTGTTFTAVGREEASRVRLRIGGAFNVANALAALATGLALGVPLRDGAKALEAFRGVPGRFEPIDEGQPFAVIVDYAHTPDGLENVLRTARQITRSRLVVVFGCGGDRDRTKRPIMGRLGASLADLAIVTSDNPRTEDPGVIIEEILAGIPGASAAARVEIETDRRTAIRQAIERAEPGDVVVIAGKGHEPYQEIHGVRHPFDDRVMAREALRARFGTAVG